MNVNYLSVGAQWPCSTYLTIYNAMTNKPTAGIMAEQNRLVSTLIENGIWAKMDIFYCFAQYSNAADEALINWVNPGTYNADNVHATPWTTLQGFAGDGTNDYISTNYLAVTNAINTSQNSVSMGVYSRTNVSNSKNLCGTIKTTATASGLFLGPRSSGDTAYFRLNQSTSSAQTGVVPDSTGMFIITRTGASSGILYRNGSSIGTTSGASVTPYDAEIYVLCANQDGTPTGLDTREVSFFFISSTLTAGEVIIVTNAIEKYMDYNGLGVI